jgi:hypothetical protein
MNAEHAAAGTLDNPEAKTMDKEAPEAEAPMTRAGLTADLAKALGGAEEEEHPTPEKTAGDETPEPSRENEQEREGAAGGEDKPEPGEEAEPTPAEKQQWPESYRSRIDKITQQRGELRERVDALEQERNELNTQVESLRKQTEAGTGTATPEDPLGFIRSTKDLREFEGKLKVATRDIEDFLDDALPTEKEEAFKKWAQSQGAFDPETGEYDSKKLKFLKRTGEDLLKDSVPHRAEFIRAEAENSTLAEQRFPWLKNQQSAEYKQFQRVLETLPEVRRLPNWKGVAAIFVRGLQAVNADKEAAAKNGNGKARPAAPRLPGAASAVPARQSSTGGDQQVNSLREKALRSGNPKDYASMLAAQIATAV